MDKRVPIACNYANVACVAYANADDAGPGPLHKQKSPSMGVRIVAVRQKRCL